MRKIAYSMYGTRDAAQNWCEEYSATLKRAGYTLGIANPFLSHSPVDSVSLMVMEMTVSQLDDRPELGSCKLHWSRRTKSIASSWDVVTMSSRRFGNSIEL